MILSNPKTHAINMSSNLATEIGSFVEKGMGAGIEAIKHPLDVSARELYFGQAGYSALGAIRGMKEAIRRVKFAWENGVTETGASKLEIPSQAIKGKFGEGVRTPLRALMVEDEAFKGIIYTDDLYSQAYKMTTKEGLRGEVRKSKIAELVANPTEEMKAKANQTALSRTFQSELGDVGKALMNLRRSGPGSEFLFPFVKTPINIVKYGIERTPFGTPRAFFGKKLTPELKAQLQGATALSTILTVIAAEKVINGDITGAGPTNQNEKKALYLTGWQPYSIKVGNSYYSYARLEPMATILGIIADLHDVQSAATSGELDKAAALTMVAVKNDILNKTFFTTFSNMFDAIDDPARYGDKWIKSMSGSAVPAVAAGVARATDPYLRETKTMLDVIKARIPGLSKTLPPRLSPTGEPVKRPGTPISRMFSPVDVSKEIQDPLWTELNRLKVYLGTPKTTGGKKLADEDIRGIVETGGPEMHKALMETISSMGYQKLADETKVKLIKRIVTKYRSYGKRKYMSENK